MSRPSLRLEAPPGDRGSPYGNASFSVGVPARREAASSKSSRRPHLSVSCSQSLLQTPAGRPSLHHQQHHLNSSLHSVASDASLLSSMLEESSIQEKTLVDSFWGLDHDGEPQDDTILSEHSASLANSTLVSSWEERRHGHPAQTQTSMVNGHHCREYPLPSDRMQALGALQSSGEYARPTARAPVGALGYATSPTPTIYGRDKSRKCKQDSWKSGGGMESAGPGAQNGSVGDDPKSTPMKEPAVVPSSSPPSPSPSSSSSSSSSSFVSSVLYLLLGLLWIASSSAGAYLWQLAQRVGSAGWVVTQRRVSDLRASSPPAGQVGSSVLHWLERGWSHAVSAMSLFKNFLLDRCLPNLFRIALLLLLLLLLSALLGWWDPREALSSMLPADGADWRDALPLSSVPGLAAMLRPPQKTSDHQSAPSPTTDQATDIQTYTQQQPPPFPPPAMQEAETEGGEGDGEGDAAPPRDSERLQQLELSLQQLWERVEQSGHRAEQMHGQVLGLYHGLRQQLAAQAGTGPGPGAGSEPDRAGLEPWLNGLLEVKLAEMKVRLEEDRLHREQTRKQYTAQQKSQAFRLAELEQLLQALSAKMEQVQRRQEAVATVTTTLRPTSASMQPTVVSGVDSESHNALRSDVSRLEVALGSVRQDLKGLRGCQDHCDRLDTIQGTLFSQVRAQVREELRAALYGNQLVSLSQTGSPDDGDGDPDNDQTALPDSLLQWLAERFVSEGDLRASLSSLEVGILRNVSQQLEKLERHRGEPDEDSGDDDHQERRSVVTQAVVDSLKAAGAGVTEEDVQLMVQNALRLYSQDRTGLADYALESGGGSVLSTRCSETYGTRTALLSLFGLPLWYFSQSPRVVIQPDVQPGNCWAFKGSTGYLVIRLSMRVRPTAFSLEHIPKALAPSGALRSAPRDFAVHGLDDESQEEGKLLGSYSYEEDGEALQTFDVTEENEQAFQIIEVRILSNWGNPEYTCMYRLRVHGAPGDD